MGLHPFETMWREHRKEIGPHLEKLENTIFKDIEDDEDSMPPEIHHPFWRVEFALKEFFKNAGDILSKRDIFAMASLYHILLTWRNDKAIYKIDPILYDCLVNVRLPEKTPFSCIKLPRRSILLDIPTRPYIFCYYDCVGLDDVGDSSSSELFLVIAEITLNKPHPIIELRNIDTNCNDLNSYLLSRTANVSVMAPEHIDDECKYQTKMRDFIAPVLNILAYINGEDDIVNTVHPGQKPKKYYVNKDKQRRSQDISEPEEYIIGKKFASVLERWEQDQQRSDQAGGHHSPRPHIRSAHTHLYWTGEGRKEPKVHFLPPISIMGGSSGKPEIPHTTHVK